MPVKDKSVDLFKIQLLIINTFALSLVILEVNTDIMRKSEHQVLNMRDRGHYVWSLMRFLGHTALVDSFGAFIAYVEGLERICVEYCSLVSFTF